MISNFKTMEKELVGSGKRRRVVLAGSEDDLALSALVRAADAGFAEPILVGDSEVTSELLRSMGKDPDGYRLIDAKSEMRAARAAIKMVVEDEADIPMKGKMQTAVYLMAIRTSGISEADATVNEMTAFHYADDDRIIVTGDCAVNVAPTLQEKTAITRNLIEVAHGLGADPVRVAELSVLEKPDPGVPSSVEAAKLAGMDWGAGIIVEGPLALDNILSAEAATHKGIASEVAGQADVIVVPDIHAGNVLHKCAHFFGHYPFASGLCGAKVPVIMNSRTDDADSKYNSIMVAVMQSIHSQSSEGVRR